VSAASPILLASDRTDVRKHVRPWWKQGSRVLQNPFASLGTSWCPTCRGEAEVDEDASHRRGLYVYKKSCCRCGTVVGYGAYQVPAIAGPQGVSRGALEWVTTPGKDRR
jgi:hypothetical protein